MSSGEKGGMEERKGGGGIQGEKAEVGGRRSKGTGRITSLWGYTVAYNRRRGGIERRMDA